MNEIDIILIWPNGTYQIRPTEMGDEYLEEITLKSSLLKTWGQKIKKFRFAGVVDGLPAYITGLLSNQTFKVDSKR